MVENTEKQIKPVKENTPKDKNVGNKAQKKQFFLFFAC